MAVRKAVLLVAGEGKRLEPITATRPKHMIPLGGMPLLEHTIRALRDVGVRDILLVVGYLKEVIQDYFGTGSKWNMSIDYIEQKAFLGTANATELGKDFTSEDEFLMMYGDLLVDPGVLEKFTSFVQANPADAIISLRRVPDPSKYGIITLDDSNNVKTIIEKPPAEMDVGNLANAGVYLLNAKIYDAISRTELSPRKEYELTDSLQILVDEGQVVKGFDIGQIYWSDVGHPWQLLEANEYIMEKFLKPEIRGKVEPNVQVSGTLYVGPNSLIKSGTYIEGPVFIGEDTVIGPNAYLRPFASIGNHCRVGNSSEVKASIVLDGSLIPHLSYVGDSVIGQNVNLAAGTTTANVRLDKANVKMTVKDIRVDTGRRKLGAIIGDNVQTGIHVNFMPGVKIGHNAFIGANTLVDEDVTPNSVVYVDQIKKMNKKLDDK